MIELQIDLLENELKELYRKLEIIENTIGEIQKDITTNITYGSRVLIEWEGDRNNEGRVVSDVSADGTMLVNRDGYSGTIRLGRNKEGLTKHKLYNLSVGTYGQLEKQQWQLNEEIEKKKHEIQKFIKNKEITLKIVYEVIELEVFKLWYIGHNHEKTISYSELFNTKDFILKAYVNEFFKETSKETLLPILIKYNIKL
ncbi:MAG: hypothetical protein WCJ61_14260 [Paludibacter sp.]